MRESLVGEESNMKDNIAERFNKRKAQEMYEGGYMEEMERLPENDPTRIIFSIHRDLVNGNIGTAKKEFKDNISLLVDNMDVTTLESVVELIHNALTGM